MMNISRNSLSWRVLRRAWRASKIPTHLSADTFDAWFFHGRKLQERDASHAASVTQMRVCLRARICRRLGLRPDSYRGTDIRLATASVPGV
jgi:hypothetical protein